MIRPGIFCRKWPMRSLDEVVEFLDHLRKPVKEKDRVPGPYPYYGANGQQGTINGYLFDESLVLLAEDGGHFGVPGKPIAYQVDGKCWVNNHAHVLRPRKSIDIRFLCRQLEHYDVTPFISGTTRAKLTKRSASRIPIVVPPLPEQRRIAAILDKADAIRHKRQEAIRCFANLKPSIFRDMFGNVVKNSKDWPTTRFGEVCDSRLGKMLDAKQQTGNHQRPYLRNANVQWNRLDLSEVLKMDFREKDRKIFRLRYGDVLICEGGEVGRAALWHDQLPECYFQKALHRVRPDPAIVTSEYIVNLMWSYAHNGGFKKHVTSATIAHLTGVKLKEIAIPIPPLSLQKEFVAQVRKTMKLESEQVKTSRRLDELFNSLVQRAFRGLLEGGLPKSL